MLAATHDAICKRIQAFKQQVEFYTHEYAANCKLDISHCLYVPMFRNPNHPRAK